MVRAASNTRQSAAIINFGIWEMHTSGCNKRDIYDYKSAVPLKLENMINTHAQIVCSEIKRPK